MLACVAQDLDAVDLGKAQVEQNDHGQPGIGRVRVGVDVLESLFAVATGHQRVGDGMLLERLHAQIQVHLVVLHHQDGTQTGRAAEWSDRGHQSTEGSAAWCGKSTRKAAPSPGEDWARMRPPSFSTNLATMA